MSKCEMREPEEVFNHVVKETRKAARRGLPIPRYSRGCFTLIQRDYPECDRRFLEFLYAKEVQALLDPNTDKRIDSAGYLMPTRHTTARQEYNRRHNLKRGRDHAPGRWPMHVKTINENLEIVHPDTRQKVFA